MPRIVLDAMGSDNHPEPEIEAAIEAGRIFDDVLYLVGDESRLKPELASRNATNVQVIHAPDTFNMSGKISRGMLRNAQDSMALGLKLVKENKADAFVTMGNTGGAMAHSLTQLKRIPGVKRPALSVLIPVKGGSCVVLDIGANAECKPEFLLQFALMGSAYATTVLGFPNPRVGLLSNGEEAGKGNDLVKETYPLLEASDINFIGNVEGKELYGGEVDVVVTDGFTGNVMVKASEAVAKLLVDVLKEQLTASLRTSIGALLAKPAFNGLKKMLDPDEVGGAPLLGVDGLVFVGHGRSGSRAVLSAIQLARHSVETGLLNSIRGKIEAQVSASKAR